MRFYKTLLLSFCLFVMGAGLLRAQSLDFKIDSLHNPIGNLTATGSMIVYSNDTIYLYCHLTNNTLAAVNLLDTGLSFAGLNRDTVGVQSAVTSNLRYIDTAANQTLLVGDSAYFTLALINTTTDSLPDLLPTGSSVVIWPVYGNLVPDSAVFTLYYAGNSGIGGVSNLYNFIKCDFQSIYIQFTSPEKKTVELFDATGRRAYEGENDRNNDAIDWSALPAGIYILRIRQGDQNAAVKLVHF